MLVRSTGPGSRNAAREIRARKVRQPGLSERTATSPEVVALFSLCMLDMVSSAWLFRQGLATEGNPLLRGAADAGTIEFVLVKLVSFIPGLIAAEWYRHVRPRFTRHLLRCVIAAYLVIYSAGVLAQFF